MRNGPSTLATLQLPIQSEVRVFREKIGWTEPFKLLATDGETCTIAMDYGPAKFRITNVKPYLRERMDTPSIETVSTNEDLPPQRPLTEIDQLNEDAPEDAIVVDVPARRRHHEAFLSKKEKDD